MMSDSIFLTCWPRKDLYGPGRKLGIMAAPRKWEHGDGSVPSVTPMKLWVAAVKSGEITWEDYQMLYADILSIVDLRPGFLLAADGSLVKVGDTLLCCCAVSDASEGRCHRTWLASALRDSGWDVVLDGSPIR